MEFGNWNLLGGIGTFFLVGGGRGCGCGIGIRDLAWVCVGRVGLFGLSGMGRVLGVFWNPF